MPSFELEESEYHGPIPEDSVFGAEVVSVRIVEKPYYEDDGVTKVRKVEFKFVIRESGVDWDGDDIWGETPVKFNSHPDCVVGDTLVRSIGGLMGVSRAFYSGPVVEYTTSNGDCVAVTMNHPVLTGAGWTPAHLLSKGDDVLCQVRDDWVVLGADAYDVPTRIEDVFKATMSVGSHSRVVAAADNFHGDGRFHQGDVDVVGTDIELGLYLDAELAELLDEKEFGRARLQGHSPRLRRSDLFVQGDGHASACHVGRADHGSGTAALAELNMPYQTIADRAIADAETASEFQERFALTVEAGKIISVRQVDAWSGHVFNLQTTSGMYVANGTVVHNCKLKNWAQAIENVEFPLNYRLDTDTLVGKLCRIVVGHRTYEKDGQTKDHNFVRDVMPARQPVGASQF